MSRCFVHLCLLLGVVWLMVPAAVTAAPGYTDGTGQVVPYGLDARHIVSLAPNTTEMLFFLGLGERVVGRSAQCDFPAAATELPSVGGFADTSLEAIVALQPDLVVAYQGNTRELVDQLRQLKIPVLALTEAHTLADVGNQMLALLQVAGPPAVAEPSQLAAWYKRLVSLTSAGYPAPGGPTVLFGYPGEVLYTCGPESFVADLILRAGGQNALSGVSGRWPQVSSEAVVTADPDWILTGGDCGAAQAAASEEVLASLRRDPLWSKLAAVRHGQVLVLDADVLLRPGPRLLDALEQLRARLNGPDEDSTR